MAISSVLALVILGLAGISSVTASCATCLINHPQQKFCDADFVFKVRPVSSRWVDQESNTVVYSSHAYDVEYKIKIEMVFKGEEKAGTTGFIYSPKNVCNINTLEFGVRYLISGKMRGDKMEVTTCGLLEKWSDLSPAQRRGVRGAYGAQCSTCRVFGSNVMRYYGGNEIIDEMSSGLWTRQKCFFNPLASITYRHDDCETKMAYCMEQKDGTCSWQGEMAYDECFRQREYKWQLIRSFELGHQPALTCRGETDQCQGLPRRMRYKCKKALRKLPACGRGETMRTIAPPPINDNEVSRTLAAAPSVEQEVIRTEALLQSALERGLEGVESPEIIQALSPMLDERV